MVKPFQIDRKKTGFFRFKKNKSGFLITNDLGHFHQINAAQFRKFVGGRLKKDSRLYNELSRKFFIKDDCNYKAAFKRFRNRYHYLCNGPTLHIVVVTLRCNYKCVYCQANRRDQGMTRYDMTRSTAKNVVDRIFESPSKSITIEFQGGEPLLNWPVVKFIIEYAGKKKLDLGKNVHISLVTNLSLMSEDKYAFLAANDVSICTSLDGPEKIHNKNRPCPGKNSYRMTTGWIKRMRLREEERRKAGNKQYKRKVSALVTITRNSLGDLKEVIDEYVKYGFSGIHLRRLSLLGLSGGPARDVIGYSAEEFIEAWKKAMDYIIHLNKKGTIFIERATMIFLQKILTSVDPGYLDIRSPCGAGVGQIAYNHDGKVYVCDEARTLEDETFLLGDVNKQSYQQIVSSPKVKTVLLSSTLENFSCDECVYKPYCGTCPVLNYVLHGTIFPQINCTDNCKVNSAVLDYIFDKMRDKETADIFNMWLRTFATI